MTASTDPATRNHRDIAWRDSILLALLALDEIPRDPPAPLFAVNRRDIRRP